MQTQTAELEWINQVSCINLTLSWILIVCYELVVDWGNPDSLIVKLILLFFRNKATYQKQSYDSVMKMLLMVEEECP